MASRSNISIYYPGDELVYEEDPYSPSSAKVKLKAIGGEGNAKLISRYDVVWATDLVTLISLVNRRIKEGWRVQGGVCVFENMCYQAVVI